MKQKACNYIMNFLHDLTEEEEAQIDEMEHRLYEALKQENIEDLANCSVAKSLAKS